MSVQFVLEQASASYTDLQKCKVKQVASFRSLHRKLLLYHVLRWCISIINAPLHINAPFPILFLFQYFIKCCALCMFVVVLWIINDSTIVAISVDFMPLVELRHAKQICLLRNVYFINKLDSRITTNIDEYLVWW